MRKVGAVLGLWALLWVSNFSLPGWHERNFSGPQTHRTRLDVMLDVLGESRTLLARQLWFVAENYHEMLERQGAQGFTEKDVIPLYRFIAYLDPKLEEAFDILAADMYFGYGDADKALAIADEGLAYNPKSYLLYFRKAFTLTRAKRYQESIEPAEKALPLARDEFDTINCCRILISAYELDKRWPDAIRLLDLWISLRPQDVTPRNARIKLLQAVEQKS